MRAVSSRSPSFERRTFLFSAFAVVAGIVVTSLAAAESNLISADAALSAVVSGQAALIDVRSPQEWQHTGIAKGAHAITIHGPDGLNGFVAEMEAKFGDDRTQAIVVICARGNRSTLVQSTLLERGFSQVLNLREGMLGSGDGPGWLARKLPLQSAP